MTDRICFSSWSGGKDSCLALYRAVQTGAKPCFLLTMMHESGLRSRSHGLPVALLEKQAQAMGIPLLMRPATWNEYESVFSDALLQMNKAGITTGIFGDIDLEEHRQWVVRVCSGVGIQPLHPLWGEPHQQLLEEFIAAGFQATIVVIKDGALDTKFLGRVLDRKTITALEKAGVDPSGEAGEYHTVVTAGPMFKFSIPLKPEKPVFHDGYWFLNL